MTWEIFRDQIWTFVGVIIAVITLLIMIITYFLQKHKKGITYEVISENSLLTNREKIEGKIKILYNDHEVNNVKFFEIKISNNGNIGIPISDYERPIRFIYDAESAVLSAEIIKSSPESLSINLNVLQNEVIIEPSLLNSKDYFTIKTIVSNSKGDEPIVDARIKDVKEIKKQGENYYYFVFGIIGSILTIIGMFQLESLQPKVETPWTLQKTISLSLIITGYILMTFMLVRKTRFRKLLLTIIKK